jgi:hypothetical protein
MIDGNRALAGSTFALAQLHDSDPGGCRNRRMVGRDAYHGHGEPQSRSKRQQSGLAWCSRVWPRPEPGKAPQE